MRQVYATLERAAQGTATVLCAVNPAPARSWRRAPFTTHRACLRAVRQDRLHVAARAPASESELFGYEKGAFTGAARAQAGRAELADNGHAVFLDQLSERAWHCRPSSCACCQIA